MQKVDTLIMIRSQFLFFETSPLLRYISVPAAGCQAQPAAELAAAAARFIPPAAALEAFGRWLPPPLEVQKH